MSFGNVSIDFNYEVFLTNYFETNGNVKTLSNYGENSFISAYNSSTGSGYNGGSAFSYSTYDHVYQLAAIFWSRSPIKNWTENYIIGSLNIGCNSFYPSGSLVPVEFYYNGITHDTYPTPQYLYKGIGLYNSDFPNGIIFEIYGDQEQSFTVELIAGKQYDFCTWFEAGSLNQPLASGCVSGVVFNFNAVPEPGTILFLTIGGLLLRKQR